MLYTIRKFAAIAITAAILPMSGCGRHSDRQTSNGDVASPPTGAPTSTATSPKSTANYDSASTATHHSKVKGALVGAAVGHALGHHALAGAAAGALAQHERNKHPR